MGGFSRPAQRRVGVPGGAMGVSTWAEGERTGGSQRVSISFQQGQVSSGEYLGRSELSAEGP